MAEEIVVPGGRDVRGTLESPEVPGCVVACPPHPQYGGRRSDRRLTAVAEALANRDVAFLQIDYGPWDDGVGERADALAAVAWARGSFKRVGLFGYSFGGAIALTAAARTDVRVVSALAPPARAGDLETVSAIDAVVAPVQVVYGARDTTADWEPVVERARATGAAVVELPADHFFISQHDAVSTPIATFLHRWIDSA